MNLQLAKESAVMQSGVQLAPGSKRTMWPGRIISAIPAVILLFGGIMKLAGLPSVAQGFAQYGYQARSIPVVGILEVACTVVYLVPRTAVLGAILMTGLLGGAIASNVRINNPAFVAPLILGLPVWGGLYFRDPRLRALIPLRH
ncbi:MAG TPA: DoxX family protein [Terriglobales bacterium]|nr:DoxX family protein [Terriglobales bacterium]